ncbi:TPA: hypothetical protein ACOW35_002875, partial [Enterococcus faecalis]
TPLLILFWKKKNREATTCLGLMVTYTVYITLSYIPIYTLFKHFHISHFHTFFDRINKLILNQSVNVTLTFMPGYMSYTNFLQH